MKGKSRWQEREEAGIEQYRMDGMERVKQEGKKEGESWDRRKRINRGRG